MAVPAVASASTSAARGACSHTPVWDFIAATGLRSLVSATSKDPNAKFTILLVSPETGMPVLVVKAPTTPGAERAVDAEAHVLAEISSKRPGSIAKTIPRLIDVVSFEQRRAAVMTALPGQPMSTAYAGRRHTRVTARVESDFAAVAAWLVEFQRETVQGPASLEMDTDVTARLQARFSGDALLAGDLDQLAQIHERLRANEVPRTLVHGDFWFGNVLVSDGHVSGVVDWEASAVCGEPVRDLVRFANMYALYLDRSTKPGRNVAGHPGLRAGHWGAALEYAIFGTGWFPTLYRRFLEDGLIRLGASPQSWRDAALAGIAEVSALTDHHEFGRLHLELFRRLTASGGKS